MAPKKRKNQAPKTVTFADGSLETAFQVLPSESFEKGALLSSSLSAAHSTLDNETGISETPSQPRGHGGFRHSAISSPVPESMLFHVPCILTDI
jgi:hypothetical protein